MQKGGFLRVLGFIAVFLWLKKKVSQIYNVLSEVRRRRALLLRLPGPRSKGFGILGSFLKVLPEGKTLSDENICRYFVRELGEIVEQFRSDGLIRLMILNEKLPIHSLGSVFVFDIDIAREILATRNLDRWEKGYSYVVSRPLIGRGVLSTSGQAWAHQRAIVEKGFKHDILEQNFWKIFKTAKEHCDKFIDLCSKNGRQPTVVDVPQEMLKTTVDVLGRVAFSYDIGSVKAANTADAPLYFAFENIIQTLCDRIRSPLKHACSDLPLPSNLRFKRNMHKLNEVVDNIIKERLERAAASSASDCYDTERANDLLDVLMSTVVDSETEKAPTSSMSRDVMIDNIKTLLFAGHDTTASATTWLLYICAIHPTVADQIREEAVKHLGDLNHPPDLEKLERMPYLNACVLELLRLYPSAAFTRTALEDVVLGGKHLIPKGTEVFVYPYYIHRDERHFPNATQFIPERWMENKTGNEDLTLQAQLAKETLTKPFLPFSLGKRNCVGRPLALLEIRILTLLILKTFNIRIPTQSEVETNNLNPLQDWPGMTLTLNPMDINLVYEPRA